MNETKQNISEQKRKEENRTEHIEKNKQEITTQNRSGQIVRTPHNSKKQNGTPATITKISKVNQTKEKNRSEENCTKPSKNEKYISGRNQK